MSLLYLQASLVKTTALLSVKGHHFYAPMLNRNSIVVDLGAHVGEFAQYVSASFGCRCYAVEASPELYARIPESPLIERLNYAIAEDEGPVVFELCENPEMNHVSAALPVQSQGRRITVPGVNLESLLVQYKIGEIDLLKVDIEGSEIGMFDGLSDERLLMIRQITVEFHDFLPNTNYDAAIIRIKRRLISLGFTCTVFSKSDHGDVLFLNKRLNRLSPSALLYFGYIARYSRGLGRVLTRQWERFGGGQDGGGQPRLAGKSNM